MRLFYICLVNFFEINLFLKDFQLINQMKLFFCEMEPGFLSDLTFTFRLCSVSGSCGKFAWEVGPQPIVLLVSL